MADGDDSQLKRKKKGNSKWKNKRSKLGESDPERDLIDIEGASDKLGSGGSKEVNPDPKRYSVRKRAPPREDFDVQPEDIFVNEKSHFVAQLSRCRKLLNKGHREIHLRGLGKAIPRAINIATELQKVTKNTITFTVNTSTVQVYDDVTDLEDPGFSTTTKSRNLSSVDIHIKRIANFP